MFAGVGAKDNPSDPTNDGSAFPIKETQMSSPELATKDRVLLSGRLRFLPTSLPPMT